MTAWPKTEQELASVVVGWLESNRWEVYKEVYFLGVVADIVAVLGDKVWVIETKRSFGFRVIEQAVEWKRHAHYTSVAVPERKTGGLSWSEMETLKHFGLGLLFVKKPLELYDAGPDYEGAVRCMPAPLTRLVDRFPPRYGPVDRSNLKSFERGMEGRPSKLIDALHKEQKESVAGAAGGGHWTPFKRTCRDVVSLVAKEPGLTIKEVVARVNHHYASDSGARGALPVYIHNGIIDGVELRREGKALRLYPAPQQGGSK